MTEKQATECGGVTDYHRWERQNNAPRNISPAMMERHKAMVFNAFMSGNFTANPELSEWETFTRDKKKLVISAFKSVDDVRWILAHEDDTELCQLALTKRKELELVAESAGIVVR